jgi:hypothetical protein
LSAAPYELADVKARDAIRVNQALEHFVVTDSWLQGSEHEEHEWFEPRNAMQ